MLVPELDPEIDDAPVTDNVGVLLPVSVMPLTDVGVIAAKPKVTAPVVSIDGVIPLLPVILDTPLLPDAVKTPPVKDNPVLTVTFENPPEPSLASSWLEVPEGAV